ncbi:hypothetical protein A9P82_09615 [Arachidicoccus ginsenosidimutans]|uniref:hypothetical protein n=1 Tax=Arachidicoccus sp. BS20 TaxID=1850526 RepID=UPI0007F05D73|nr:hypothetical protein [Arachidicoccus sp. BS20]ANI89524.1 hypothetical protein A9P82_09615 [Arachidicoccus sp. BS20]
MRKIVFIIVLSFISIHTFAQSDYVYGKLIDSITLLPVQDVQVLNVNTGETDITNSKGLFLLKGHLNDTLSFVRIGYQTQRFVLAGNKAAQDTIQIILIPKTEELKSVTVSAYSYADYQADSTERRRSFEQSVGYAHHYFEGSNSGAGIGFSLDRLFSKKEKKKENAYRIYTQYEEQRYVDFRFNPIIVHSYTGLRGDSLQQFINRYQPSYKWLRSHKTSDDIFYYINDKMKELENKN